MSAPKPPPDATDPTAPSLPKLFEDDDATLADTHELRAIPRPAPDDEDDRTEVSPRPPPTHKK